MINTFIAYDENDSELGEYFEGSHDDIRNSLLGDNSIQSISIQGLNCTEDFINNALSQFKNSKFIFIAISHGNEDELVSNETYVSSNNLNSFSNSLFYSSACLTGYKLGHELINAGCLCFVGYSDTVLINVDYFSLYYACQNYGIKHFLSGNYTIEEAFFTMKDFYNNEIDRLVEGSMEDFIAASSLIHNRESLILLGSKVITKLDFN